nr:TonB-dependent receptor [Solimonas soli]
MSITLRIATAIMLALLANRAAAQADTQTGAPASEGGGDSATFSTEESSLPENADSAAQEPPAEQLPSIGLGDEPPPPVEKSGRSAPVSRMVEEVIVTAQKREEALMSVPISVQAFSPEALEARGVSDQMGLAKIVPGMDVGSQAGFSTVFIRGVGTDAWLTADPSVAAYVDGVYYSFTPSVIQEFGAVKRVEVLKGPQGTLFGRNAVGGAINVITKDPDFFNSETQIETGYQSFNTYKNRLYTNLPLTDNFAVNLSAFYNSGDSYLEGSTSAGKPLFREIGSGVRAKVRWAPLDDLDMKFAFMRTHGQINGAMPSNLDPSPLGRLLGVQPADKYETHVDERLYLDTDSTVYSGEILKNFDWLDVKIIGSDQHHEAPYNYDFDGSIRPLVSFDIPVHYGNIQEAELQLLSNQGTPGSDWLTVTGGVFFYHNQQGFDPIKLTVANLDPRKLSAAGINLPLGLSDALENAFGPGSFLGGLLDNLGIPSPGVPFYSISNVALVETKSLSEYLQITAKLTDWVSLTLGGRYQSEERGVKESKTRVQVLDLPQPLTVIDWKKGRDGVQPEPLSSTTKGFKPKVALDFHPFDDDTLIYASWQKALKAHAYNAFAIYLRPAYVKPENTTAYEVGLKTTLFDQTTRLSTAAFWYDISDLQTQFVSLLNGGAVSFENAGNARSRGIDFDLTSLLFPSLLNGVAMTLNGAYIDAIYTSYPHGSGYNKTTKIFSSNNDYTGNRQVRTPKWSGSLALTKTWGFDMGSLEIGANYYYNSGFFYTASNDPDYEQPAYHTVGAHISFHYDPWDMGVKVFGENLSETFYTNGLLVTDFGPNYAVAPPRVVGVVLDWKF